ncbi:MAG: hypothetical protein ACI4UC_08505 [Alloprevotella sp.]
MKRVLLSLLAILMVSSAFAQDMAKEGKTLLTTLKKMREVTAVKPKAGENNTLELNYKKGYYEIKLESTGSTGLLQVTISTSGLKLTKGKYFEGAVREVTNSVNDESHAVKVVMESGRVAFEEQFFVKSTASLDADVIKKYLDNLSTARTNFTDTYKTVNKRYKDADSLANEKKKADSLANVAKKEKIDNGDSVKVIKVDRISDVVLVSEKAENVNAHGDAKENPTEFKENNTEFVLLTLTLNSKKVGKYTICARIIDPEGIILTTDKEQKYTLTQTFEFKKVDKDVTQAFSVFGSNTQKIWKTGTYKVEYWEVPAGDEAAASKIGESKIAIIK